MHKIIRFISHVMRVYFLDICTTLHRYVPQCVAFLGIDAEEKLPGLVGPLRRRHYDVMPRVQVHLPPHGPKVPILSRASHQWVRVKERLVKRTRAVLQLLG